MVEGGVFDVKPFGSKKKRELVGTYSGHVIVSGDWVGKKVRVEVIE